MKRLTLLLFVGFAASLLPVDVLAEGRTPRPISRQAINNTKPTVGKVAPGGRFERPLVSRAPDAKSLSPKPRYRER